MSNKVRRLLRVNPNGFTLIEVMITLAISGIVMGAIYGIFISSSQSHRTQEGVADAQQRARVGLDFMVRNIRMAGLDPSGNGIDPIEGGTVGIKQATPAIIRFTADMDMNGTIDEANDERLTYTYNGANQTLSQIRYEGTASESPQTLIDMVSAMTFAYLDANDAVTANLPDIRAVTISITCQGMGARGQLLTRTLNTRVNLRN
ncbi:MAG: prepilin-type N-terminal cleavage/methylation domain-containing protein [Desulfobacteraceae bacterium]|nr:MAG: prepilin-type N-terminal cleavage/methylation domain-containing protein [Desulfobacteraceae bacterium]